MSRVRNAKKAEDAMKKKKKDPVSVVEARRQVKYARSTAKVTLEAIDAAINSLEAIVPGGFVEAVKALRSISNAHEGTSAKALRGLARGALKQIRVGEFADAIGASGEPS